MTMPAPILWARRAWEWIAEPKRLNVVYVIVYALTLAIGVQTLRQPPQSIEGPLGEGATILWASLFILGGAVGLLTVLPGWWWLERLLAIAPVCMGLTIYLAIVIALHIQGSDEGSSRLTQAGVIILAAFPFLLRSLFIWESSYAPRRE